MPRTALILVLFAVLACSSGGGGSQRPPEIPQPEFRFSQPGPIFFGSGSTAPVTIDVEVLNRAATPIVLREIELSSPSMSQYSLYPVRRIFKETIGPGEVKRVTVFATAVTNVARLRPSEPLSVRAIVTFESGKTRFREMVNAMNIGG